MKHPEGNVDQLGSAPILQSAMRTPTLLDGIEVHEGIDSIGDVYRFHTRDQAFNYQFEIYGDTTTLASGHIEDIRGNTYLSNRFGFIPHPIGREFRFDLPGEFCVDIAAVYEGTDGDRQSDRRPLSAGLLYKRRPT